MQLSRRDVLKLLGTSMAASTMHALAEEPSKTRIVRLPLEEFVQHEDLLKALRKGVREMNKRPPSDPRSWFFQAAIHGVTAVAVDEQMQSDPKLRRSCWTRNFNQCPHFGENSANFLPWHRGYTYHFEQILRVHTERSDFALPYWNYTDLKQPKNRYFPKEFGIEHLDGNLENNNEDNINALYHKDRDFYFCGYEHPFATGLPLLMLSETSVDISLPMNADVFFGYTEREGLGGGIADDDGSTRGLLESYPHDHIHRSVGGVIGDNVGAMATPPTAGFDPIFPVHHSNIDRLWALWSCMPGKTWGKLPPRDWFNARPWIFFDTDGNEVNEPRKKYFDHRALGIRFKDEDEACTPLQLPEAAALKAEALADRVEHLDVVTKHERPLAAVPAGRTVIRLAADVAGRLDAPAKSVRAALAEKRTNERVIMRLKDVRLGLVQATGFDVHLTLGSSTDMNRRQASFVGSIALFRHDGHGDTGHAYGMESHSAGESFDVTNALAGAGDLSELSVVLVPYSLLGTPEGGTTMLNNRETLKSSGIEFFKLRLR